MKLKYGAAALAAGMLAAVLTTGCGTKMQDGIYRAEYRDYDSHGWKDYVEITVTQGKISHVDYDSVNEAGERKSLDEEYRASMEPVAGTYPEKYMKELEEELLQRQEPKKVTSVAGATTSSDAFKVLSTEAISKGVKKGNTQTVVVE